MDPGLPDPGSPDRQGRGRAPARALEALRLFLRKLRPGGVLAFNVSSRHLDLAPVLGNLARAAGPVSLTRDDAVVSEAERAAGKVESRRVVMARRSEQLGDLAAHPGWRLADGRADRLPWTDDYASLLDALRWSRRRP